MADIKIPYVNRSYAQIKEYILTRIFGSRDVNGNFVAGQGLVPEMTDHTENNLMVRITSIWAGIAEMLGYYIDSSAREAFLQTCRRYRSAVLIARFYDYRIKCRTAASVGITFYLNQAHTSNITIPANTQVRTEDNISFFTTTDLVIPVGQTRGTVSARNSYATSFQQLAVSNGQANQEYEIPSSAAYNGTSIRIGGVSYFSKDTLAFSNNTDRHFIETVNESGNPVVRFGDGYNGIIPGNGSVIEVSYQVTNGASGNVSTGQINTIVSSLTLPMGISLTCNNLLGGAGGAEIQSLTELKRRIPLSNRTKMRAVIAQDYIDIAETYPSVDKAGVETECGAAIKLYIVPVGGGVASSQLLTDVALFFEDKKILGRQLIVLPSGEVRTKWSIRIKVRADFSESTVFDAVKANMVNFLSYQNQSIGGRVELSDMYELIENTEGVIASKIDIMTTIPFARPNGVWQTLDWSVNTLPTSNTTTRWGVKFVTTSTYQLFREDVYVGTHSVGSIVTRSEVQFTINANYAVGDNFTFVTYPYFGTIQLNEPSVPVVVANDITLSAY